MTTGLKRFQREFAVLIMLAGAVILLLNQTADAAPPKDDPTEGVFTEIGIEGRGTNQPSQDGMLLIQRQRPVGIDFDQLPDSAEIADLNNQSRVAYTIPLNLFNDVFLRANISQIQPNPSGGGQVWSGNIAGIPHSTVSFVLNNDLLTGDIRLPRATSNGQVYQIRPGRHGGHIIRQVLVDVPGADHDDSAVPPIPVDTRSSDTPFATSPELIEDGSVIDIMVAFTPQARDHAGGFTAMFNEIDQAIALTNQAFTVSGIATRLRLVHTVEVNYTSSGDLSIDNQRLTNKDDGFMDKIHTLRNTHAADLVSLIVHADARAAGQAWLLQSLSPSLNEAYGFSVVDICCATAGLIFSHEIGHNLGAAHDWHTASVHAIFPYGYGFTDRNCGWKTIMAYGSECGWIEPIPYFSNPDVQYDGNPTGIPEGTKSPCLPNELFPDCDADNRKLANETAIVVANYRVNQANVAPVFSLNLESATPFVQANSAIFDYNITLKNIGNMTATDVQITNVIPVQTEFVSAIDSGAFINGAISWSGLELAPDETLTLTFQVRPFSGTLNGMLQIEDTLANAVSVTSAEGASVPETTFITAIMQQVLSFPVIFR